ncbi:MAG TPA: sigma-54 dependent transcriptional regulator [Dissulfurispiraceae bacterium]|nr:sigma-54 dependent transcriptional regulator [Dissulfurispiraceae bacterium]
MAERILIVEDESELLDKLRQVFEDEGFSVETASDGETAIKLYDEGLFDAVITDIILPGIDGIELLRRIKERSHEQVVIIMTAFASLDTAVRALKGGAYDYLMKPLMYEEIKQSIRNALRERTLHTENVILRKEIEKRYDFGKIIGESVEIKAVVNEVRKIADSRSNVLLLGETGTGKELFARAIHYNSARHDRPFIPVNCSAIPEALLESEFFGYAKGAFTGATSAKRGLLETADGGTIFLDEIGDLPLPLQAKLLRVLDDREVRPLGSVHARKVELRIVAATNRDLAKEIQRGLFREDLFYRINVVSLRLPPLRERTGDIRVLAEHFVLKYASEEGKQVSVLDEPAMRLLMSYHWPGNVRELQNILERAVLLAAGESITPAHLPEELRSLASRFAEAAQQTLSIEDYTKDFIVRHQVRHSEQQIADMLGITRKALWEKRKRWGLKRT